MTPESLCPEKKRLLDEFTAAVSAFLRIESARTAGLLLGSEPSAELEGARKRKDTAKAAVLAHQKEHGC
jgi:hypothetical protein